MEGHLETSTKDKDIKIWTEEEPTEKSDWGAFVLPTFATFLLIMGFAFLSTIFLRARAESRLESLLLNRPFGSVTYKSLRVSFIWDQIEIRGVKFTPAGGTDSVRVQRIIVSGVGRDILFRMSKHELQFPNEFQLGIVGLSLPRSALSGDTQGVMTALGYQTLDLSLSSHFKHDTVTGQTALEKTVVDVGDMGRIIGSAIIEDFSFPKGEAAFDGIFDIANLFESPAWQAAYLKTADFQFQNNEFTDRMEAFARERGEDGSFTWLGIDPRSIASASTDFATQTGKKLAHLSLGERIHFRVDPPERLQISEIHRSLFNDINGAQKILGLSLLEN